MTVINRRQLLAGLLASSGLLLAACGRDQPLGIQDQASQIQASSPMMFSACDDHTGQHLLCGWRANGEGGMSLAFRLPVPHRAHDVWLAPEAKQAVFFARRPGRQMYWVDIDAGELLATVEAPANHHFFGHGCLAADGRTLCVSENVYGDAVDSGCGVIGLYDSQDRMRRVGQYEAAGIGTHQLALMPDGHTLVVANGGIQTHPSRGREKLNLATMQSSLSYIDSRDGHLLAAVPAADPQMSLRHLAVTPQGQVIVGAQYQGDANHWQPLVFVHQGESQLQSLQADHGVWASHRQYVASVAVDTQGQTALTTSPRGGGICLWDLASAQLLRQLPMVDVAGAAYLADLQQFVVSNGVGQVALIQRDSKALRPWHQASDRWDNHLRVAPV